ncbi:7840_t:CDS:2, partial [Cetraspora pellucida]
GWFRAGSDPVYYLMRVDSAVFCENSSGKSGFIKFDPAFEGKLKPGVFGTLMQSFMPREFLGKRDVTGWAGLWMRVDTKTTQTLDNMSDRSLKGTGDWKKCECILDVGQDAVNLAFGVLVS